MKKIILGLVVGAALAGCSKGGDEFVGTWQWPKSHQGTLDIEKSGDSYTVKTSIGSLDCNIATYQNGRLVCGSGMMLDYDKNQNTLIVNTATGALILTK